jgi:hypothetical protein
VLDVAKSSVLKSADNITMFLFFISLIKKKDKQVFYSFRAYLKTSHPKNVIFLIAKNEQVF